MLYHPVFSEDVKGHIVNMKFAGNIFFFENPMAISKINKTIKRRDEKIETTKQKVLKKLLCA